MTCRIRAGEVARPRCRGFTPRAARSGHGVTVPATRRAWVLHSCRSTSRRPVIRAAAGLGVRPDRPAVVAGACRQTGIFTYGCPKTPMNPSVCVVTHHAPVRVDALTIEPPAPPVTTSGPAPERLVPPTVEAWCATGAVQERERNLHRKAVGHSGPFRAACPTGSLLRPPCPRGWTTSTSAVRGQGEACRARAFRRTTVDRLCLGAGRRRQGRQLGRTPGPRPARAATAAAGPRGRRAARTACPGCARPAAAPPRTRRPGPDGPSPRRAHVPHRVVDGRHDAPLCEAGAAPSERTL